MSWKIKLNNGRIDAFYDDQLVLEGVELRGYDQEDEIKFLLAPYGKPYPVAAPAGEQIVYILKLVPQNTGPTDIIMEIFCGPLRLALRLYPRKPLGFKLSGMVHWGWEPYLCRIEPGQFKDVVQAALGPANSLLCDCLFDKWTDRVLRFNADDIFQIKANPSTGDFWVESQLFTQFGSIPEILAVEVINHFVTEHRSMPHYVPYDRTHHPLPPSGWESWYCYGRQTSEEILIRITDWLAKHLKPFGCEVVQWDDGYQDENWLEWRRDLFPHGGKWIADYIHSKGFKPGIWVLPQSLGKIDSKLLETKPDWLLRKPDGEVFRGFANYPYVDPTHPEVKKEWFQKIFHTMAREWGIDFFKIDGEGEMQQWYALCRDQLYDPSLTPDEAYRGWLKIIREAIGQERTLLICATRKGRVTSSYFSSSGYSSHGFVVAPPAWPLSTNLGFESSYKLGTVGRGGTVPMVRGKCGRSENYNRAAGIAHRALRAVRRLGKIVPGRTWQWTNIPNRSRSLSCAVHPGADPRTLAIGH
ncbi:hypothetical protein B5M50_02470 [candidate division KSB1 bacterium 4484_219]|nr:MAG: hypothetical protein B5M50_02470 [candidate division KSB1 bacterium 4484_219]